MVRLTVVPGPDVAALYPRVSSPGQEQDGTSLETQEAACRQFAADHGYTVDEAHVYREVHTGVELWERPQLTRLREAIRHHEVRVVIAYAIDRLARDPVHLGVILTEADHVGVRVEFVTEPLDDSPEGQLIRFVRGYAAKVEHEKIKERTWRGRLARVHAGKPIQAARAPYGYYWSEDLTALHLQPVTGPVVERIFTEILSGHTLRQVAGHLTDAGVPTPKGHTPYWSASTVRVILRNPVYTGELHALRWQQQKVPGKYRTMVERPLSERVRLPVSVPAVVDPASWAAIQVRLQRNKAAATRNNRAPQLTLLRGGIARCGTCGGSMYVTRRNGRKPPL